MKSQTGLKDALIRNQRCRCEEAAVAEIVVLIFGLRRPVRREHVFDAAANGPAILVVAVQREGDGNAGKGQRLAIVGIGVAALDVEQRRTGSVADAAGDGAEAALVVAVDVTGGEDGAEVVLAEPAILSFDTDDPARRELAFGAGPHAAEPARVA